MAFLFIDWTQPLGQMTKQFRQSCINSTCEPIRQEQVRPEAVINGHLNAPRSRMGAPAVCKNYESFHNQKATVVQIHKRKDTSVPSSVKSLARSRVGPWAAEASRLEGEGGGKKNVPV